MKNLKKISAFLIVFLLMSTVAFAAAAYKEREPNNTFADAQKHVDCPYFPADEDYVRIYGVVNNYDTVDYIKVEVDKNGPSEILLSIPSNTRAKLHLYNSDGQLITTSISGSSTSEYISDIYFRAGRTYYFKVEYISGNVWSEPYVIQWVID